jgi:hypothetical protein
MCDWVLLTSDSWAVWFEVLRAAAVTAYSAQWTSFGLWRHLVALIPGGSVPGGLVGLDERWRLLVTAWARPAAARCHWLRLRLAQPVSDSRLGHHVELLELSGLSGNRREGALALTSQLLTRTAAVKSCNCPVRVSFQSG